MATKRPRTRDPSDMRQLARRIRSVDDLGPHVKALVYGPNNSGKTRFGASAPRPLILDFNEQGTRSARGTGAKVIEIDNWDDVGNAYWLLASGKTRFETCVLDTITGMHRLAMDKVIGDAEARDPARPRSMPDKRSYGQSGQLMRGMLLAYRNLPMHVIFTAQPRYERDEDTGQITEVTVGLPAGCRGDAMDVVSIIGLLRPRRVKRGGKARWHDTLIVGRHSVYRTKDRTNNLGDVVLDPTFDKVLQAWSA